MDLNTYQKLAMRTKKNIPRLHVIYPSLKLAGEAGEVSEKVGKVLRDKEPEYFNTDEFKDAIKKELGDVLWYIASLADDLGITLDDVGATNINKLWSRQERGVISGSGDDR
jgi:NTP pyrophosphatase (non-canonical NTP hydrolase)